MVKRAGSFGGVRWLDVRLMGDIWIRRASKDMACAEAQSDPIGHYESGMPKKQAERSFEF